MGRYITLVNSQSDLLSFVLASLEILTDLIFRGGTICNAPDHISEPSPRRIGISYTFMLTRFTPQVSFSKAPMVISTITSKLTSASS